jgi:hypothetical protein
MIIGRLKGQWKMNIRNNTFISLLGTIKYYVLVESYYRYLAFFGTRPGIADTKRNPPLIISLTSIPERFHKLHLCVEALLRQSIKPDHLILWLSDTETKIPSSLQNLTKRGLEIKFCKDIRSYKKIIYTLKEFPNALIVTADDDIFYPSTWLEDLFSAYQKEPEFIHCHRAHLITKNSGGPIKKYKEWNYCADGIEEPSLLLFPTGEGGVLYAPGMLNKEVTNEQLFIELCPTADDVWLKAMSLLNNYSCKKLSQHKTSFTQIKGTQTKALWKENTTAGASKNDDQIKLVFDYFNLNEKIKDVE